MVGPSSAPPARRGRLNQFFGLSISPAGEPRDGVPGGTGLAHTCTASLPDGGRGDARVSNPEPVRRAGSSARRSDSYDCLSLLPSDGLAGDAMAQPCANWAGDLLPTMTFGHSTSAN